MGGGRHHWEGTGIIGKGLEAATACCSAHWAAHRAARGWDMGMGTWAWGHEHGDMGMKTRGWRHGDGDMGMETWG